MDPYKCGEITLFNATHHKMHRKVSVAICAAGTITADELSKNYGKLSAE